MPAPLDRDDKAHDTSTGLEAADICLVKGLPYFRESSRKAGLGKSNGQNDVLIDGGVWPARSSGRTST
jgi:hypothetical protein